MKLSHAVKIIHAKLRMVSSKEMGPLDEEAFITAKQVIELALSIGMLPPYSNEIFQKNAKIYIDPSGREWDPEDET